MKQFRHRPTFFLIICRLVDTEMTPMSPYIPLWLPVIWEAFLFVQQMWPYTITVRQIVLPFVQYNMIFCID